MAVYLSPVGNGQVFLAANALPASGGFIHTYLAGTTTPAATYTTSLGNVPNANPIILQPNGMAPYEIWFTPGQAYKFVITDFLNNPITPTYDNLVGIDDPSFISNASQIVYTPPGSGAVATTVGAKLGQGQLISVKDYGAAGDGATDD